MASRDHLMLLLGIVSLLLTAAIGDSYADEKEQDRRCRLDRVKIAKPAWRLESEGGVNEVYDQNDEEFRCAGVASQRVTVRPNSLSLPKFHPLPRLVYIEKGRGLVGITYPGCPESYQSHSPRSSQERGPSRRWGDSHQKVHRVQQGDIVLFSAGATHYCYNDGDEDLVAFSVDDVASKANQLDRKFREFYLAGGEPKQRAQGGQEMECAFRNVLRNFDERLLAEAFDVSADIISKLKKEDERGVIVKVEKGMRLITPDEREEELRGNGLEESVCNARVVQNICHPKHASIYSRSAGWINSANENTLPILRRAELSADKIRLSPGAMLAPHYVMNGHSIVYATEGEARVQMADDEGKMVMDERVKKGDVFVIPQGFVTVAKAGHEGYEAVSIKTTGQPVTSPLAGSESVMMGLPLQVVSNSFRLSNEDAEQLKQNRRHETMLLSPSERRSSS